MLAEDLHGPRARWTQTDEQLHQLALYAHQQLELQELQYYHWQLSVTDPRKRSQVPKPVPRPAPTRPWEEPVDVDQVADAEPPALATRDQVRTFFGGGVRLVDPAAPADDDDVLLAVPGDASRPPVDIEDDPAVRAAAWAEAEARRQTFGSGGPA